MTATQKSAKRTSVDDTNNGFTADEKAAMREHARELKAGPRAAGKKDGIPTCSRRSPRCRMPTA